MLVLIPISEHVMRLLRCSFVTVNKCWLQKAEVTCFQLFTVVLDLLILLTMARFTYSCSESACIILDCSVCDCVMIPLHKYAGGG